MKKLRRVGVLTLLLGIGNVLPAFSAEQVQVAVNGQYVPFPDERPYVDALSNRTMVPVRFVAEKLGLRVEWNEPSQQVRLTKKDQILILYIGQKRVQVNGQDVTFDSPAVIKNNRTMIPLRFISETFDAQIDWIAERNLVVVTTAGHTKEVPPAPPPSTVAETATIQKGTWIWDATLIQSNQDQLFAFARETGLTSIYLQVNKEVPTADYQAFVGRAKEQQIQVEALAGRPEWAFTSQQSQIHDLITWVKSYNASVGAKERFDGLHFDIEPYLLAEWKTNQKLVIENWMDNMRWIEREIKDSGLKLTMDVPFWLHLVKVPDSDYSLSAWLLEKVDAVVIMDYRNTALGNDGIVANAKTIIREASTLQKKVIVAVETSPSSEGPLTTFYSLGTGAMKAELQIALENLSHYPSFAGFAVHDYKSWTELDAKSKSK